MFEGKYRHQYYQLQSKVTVDVYAKKLKKEQVSCDFQDKHLTLVINDAEGKEEYRLDVELYGKVGAWAEGEAGGESMAHAPPPQKKMFSHRGRPGDGACPLAIHRT